MRHDPDAIMLFAAGFGTRMGALTRERPKPLIEVAGRTLLDHALALADAAGISRQVVNAHYHADQIRRHLAGRRVAIAEESPDILDTGGGLRAALPLLTDDGEQAPVWTLNTDAVWTGPNPLTTLKAAWDPFRMDALLLLVPSARAVGHAGPGDFALAPDGRLTRGPGLIYGGAQILVPRGIGAIPQTVFSLNALWDRIAREGRLYGVVHSGGWCDVGHPDGIAQAEAMLSNPPQSHP